MKKFHFTKKTIVIFLAILVSIVTFSFARHYVFADEIQDKLSEINKQIEEYEREMTRLRDEANTLANQVAQYDAQINLTTLKINQTQEKIDLLGGRINLLEESLVALSNAFSKRAEQTYKLSRINKPYIVFLSSDSLNDAVSSYHYLEKIQEADRDLLVRLESAQESYEIEKTDQEELQLELEGQKKVLGAQKSAKANLLTLTKNDEKRYQELLSRARAERDAIQDIIAGKGEETKVGAVGGGEKIASIIPGVSACSTGAHLHFEVISGNTHNNPASYLSSKDVIWDNDPDSSFSFSGSWAWPINDPVRITQGYGMTYYAANLKYYGGAPHTGLDMVNAGGDYTVKSVQPGTLYRGAINCGGGVLRYVRVEQENGIDTYYLHVNY